MPTQAEIAQAREKAFSSTQTAGAAASRSSTVSDELKSKLDEAYNYNQDIVGPLDEATASYLTAPQDARVKFENIFNPFQREQLVGQYVQNQAIPMLTYANILGERRGSLADTVERGGNIYNEYATGLANQATADRNYYTDLLGEFQADRDYALQLENLAINRAKAERSAGLSPTQLISTLRGFDPSATQQSDAIKAKSAMAAINALTEANEQDLTTAANLAAGGIRGIYANTFANSQQRELARAMDTLRNSLRLEFTGAAFSPDELAAYSRLTGSDPFSTFMDPKSSQEAAAELENYFSSIANLGANPYQTQLDAIMSGFFGAPSTGQERAGLESFEESY